MKNRQNLTFWPKKRISYGTGQKLTPEKSPGLETRFSHNKWTKTITIYNKKSALFGGALRKWHAWFFGSPIMGPGGQFLPKNGASRCFSTEIGHRGPWWVNQKIKHAKPAKQWRARYLLFTLSNLIKIDTRDINTTCFPLLKTNPNFVKSVLCSINSYDNFEKTYVHRITSSTQWWCNGTQISSKTQFFGPEKNFAARAPLATTSKL